MSANECRCGRPTRDAAYVCDTCADSLTKTLSEIPWLVEELQITTTRQKGVDYRRQGGGKGGKKPTEMPHPANMAASEVRGNLQAVLVSWALFCKDEGVRHQSPNNALPANNLPAISRWLLWRVDGLTLHEIGSDAVEEIADAVGACYRIIDLPADKQYLGDCDQCEGGRLYAHPKGRWARCDQCNQATEADKVREALLGQLDDRLCTAAEIADLSTYLGLHANREQVRNRVNQWHKRGRIASEVAFADSPVFRFGIVWRLLVHHDEVAKAEEKAG
jgi:hypothetical protein